MPLIGLILTIAYMNLANMLLAHGAARRKELAIRLAVGASRFRLVRQMISEGILLALLGGMAGLAPALQATKADAAPTLKGAVIQLRGYRSLGLRNLLGWARWRDR